MCRRVAFRELWQRLMPLGHGTILSACLLTIRCHDIVCFTHRHTDARTHTCTRTRVNKYIYTKIHAYIFAVLWIEPRTLHVQGKLSATLQYTQPPCPYCLITLTTCVQTGSISSFLVLETISRAGSHFLPRFKRS